MRARTSSIDAGVVDGDGALRLSRVARARRLRVATCAAMLAAPAWWSLGCGAKTGLNAPELDASVVLDAGPDATVPCIDIPLDGGPVNVALEIEAEVGRADVVFLVDTTLSMDDEIAAIRARLRDRIVPAIRAAIPDSELAVATFGDFPVIPYGRAGVDEVFRLMVPRTADVTLAQAAVDAIELGDGRDPPESQVEALFQLATGAGLSPYVPPSLGCPSGGVGYACLRTDALPVILLFTDAEMHNGPSNANPYEPGILGVTAHSFTEAIASLNAMGAKVIGFDSGDGAGRPHLVAAANGTGAVDGSGNPLVFDIGTRGNALDTEVVSAIQTFAGSLIQDVDAFLVDPDPVDGIDVLDFVEGIVPLGASPMSGISGIDFANDTFLGVEPGTQLTFQIILRNGIVVPGDEPLVLRLEVVFRGDGRNRLDSRIVYIVIPAADGDGCGDVIIDNNP